MFRVQIAWAVKNNVVLNDIKQYVTNSLPFAKATTDGLPYKSDKAKVKHIYKERYPGVFLTDIDITAFDRIVIDAMFLLYSPPLRHFSTFSEYIMYLYTRNILPYFEVGISTVHAIFDEQSVSNISPKSVERTRRDAVEEETHIVTASPIDNSSLLPPDWDKFIRIRENKKSVVNLISNEFLSISTQILKTEQTFVVGGVFSEENVSKYVQNEVVMLCTDLQSNIEEGDSRVWLHAF